MHVDGGTTQSFFVAPELNRYFPGRIDGLDGLNIYVIINGQMAASPGTTPLSPIPIVTRSYSATMRHISRRDIATAAAFAQRHGMNFRVTGLPIGYPFPGLLDFRSTTLQALFNYAVKCAASGRLWIGGDPRIERGENGSAGNPPLAQCPSEPSTTAAAIAR
jgi:hypothetical protein